MRRLHQRSGSGQRLNESPSKKEGKSLVFKLRPCIFGCLNESPSKKEGKWLP